MGTDPAANRSTDTVPKDPGLLFLAESPARNVVGDWALRLGVGCAYILFGLEKFHSGPGASWVSFFQKVGWGDWFRYFTGVVEILGAVLVIIPRTALFGLIVLSVTMAGAVLIVAFVIGRPADSIFPGMFLAGLVGAAWYRSTR